MAHPKQEQVRQRYDFRCGYCGVSETSSGGELTIDHFRPVSQNGDDSDDNLVYACNRCNQFKSDFFPDPVTSVPEHRLLHPFLDDVKLHLWEDDYGRLQALSVTGLFHIRKLRLNRPQLVEYRLIKQEELLWQEYVQRLERMLGDVNVSVEELRELSERLGKDIGDR